MATIDDFIARNRITPEQHRQLIGADFALPDGWSHNEGCQIQAPISWFDHYTISHRGDIAAGRQGHNLAYRPLREHHHVGRYATAREAFEAARRHRSE